MCEHRRLTGRKGQYSTLAEHVPPQHQGIDGLWSRRWFTDRARSFGPATVQVIEQILDRHAIEAQGYLDCQNILSGLGKANRERLEAACQELVNNGGQASYTTLKRLMAAINSDAKKPRKITPAAFDTQTQQRHRHRGRRAGAGRLRPRRLSLRTHPHARPTPLLGDAEHNAEHHGQPDGEQEAGR